MIELTPEQCQTLEQQNGEPVRTIDPATQAMYYIVRAELYQPSAESVPPADDPLPEIPPMVLRSQAAFWNNLPSLLAKKRNRGKWVAFHGEECIGIAADDVPLIREVLRRGLGKDDYYLDVIEPMSQPPWLHVEEVDYGLAEYDEVSDLPSTE